MSKTIDELPAATSLLTTDEFPVWSGAATRKATFALLPFLPSGTGALSLSVQAALRLLQQSPVYFGATGDGVADDTAAFNLCWAAGDVYLPSGYIFKLTSTPNITSRRRIFGSGKLRVGAAAMSVLKLSADYSSVEGISIDNSADLGSSAAALYGVEISADHCTVKGNFIDGLITGVVSQTDKIGNTISGNQITNVKGVASELRGDGILVAGSMSVITNNVISCKAATDGRCGIAVDEVGTPAGYNTVTGNTISGPFRRSIHIELTTNCSVVSNGMSGATYWGIINSTADGTMIANNSVATPVLATGGGADTIGIYIFHSTGCKASGNTIVGLGAAKGISVEGNSADEYHVISGNVMKGASGKLTKNGILVANSYDAVVEGNTVQSALVTLYGIDVFGSPRAIVRGNQVHGCGSGGIRLASSSTNGIVSGNLCRNNGVQGITVDSSDNATVTGNRCFDDSAAAQTYGILTSGMDNSVIEGNNLTGNATAGIIHFSLGSGNIIRDNKGWITENSGTDTITSGATTKAVTHGMNVTPTSANISVIFTEQGTNDYGRWWVDTITSTQFTVRVSADPGASNLDFSWQAVSVP